MLRTILLEPLLNLLLLFYALIPGGDFGVAIIILTIVIRILLWPLVKKQLYHQKAMRALQPEIAKLKKKAKGDKQKESQMMLELFKEREVNPFGSIGLALAQFPILIALFYVLREVVTGDIAASTYGFIQNFPAISEIIANPDAFDPTLFGYFHMAERSLILAALAGLAQFVQAKQITPQNTIGSDPAAKLGFNMVMIFPVITVAIAASLPSALALYWAFGSLIAIIQQRIVLGADLKFMQRLRERKVKKSQPTAQETKTPAKKTPAKPSTTKKPASKKPKASAKKTANSKKG
ncbi:MAG: YidC/Oxa1 family membrane protein insertase [Candidatus Saccharimonadales bacterium]